MGRRVTQASVRVTGTPRTGLWCDACLRPSGIEAQVWSLTPHGMHYGGTLRQCTDCGGPNVVDLDEAHGG